MVYFEEGGHVGLGSSWIGIVKGSIFRPFCGDEEKIELLLGKLTTEPQHVSPRTFLRGSVRYLHADFWLLGVVID